MVKNLFRYFLIIAVLMICFETITFSNSATLSDAYKVLTSSGWGIKDALGFLGASLAGTLALNPSLAPAVAAGALSAYIIANSAYLYDMYREWANMRNGIALLNPVDVSQSMNVKRLPNGQYAWSSMFVFVEAAYLGYWDYGLGYVEVYNNNGSIVPVWRNFNGGRVTKEVVIARFNQWLNHATTFLDAEGQAMFSALIRTAYNNLLSRNNFSVSYEREVVPALESNLRADTIGYTVKVDPKSISTDGVQYLSDANAFYTWFVNNYLSGVNEGVFVTPLSTAYDEIRSELLTIINKLNNLTKVGSVSEEALNNVKAEIFKALTSIKSNILDGVDSAVSSLSDINTKVVSLQADIAAVKTGVDALTTEIKEAHQQEKGFWSGLLRWLNETLWAKLREFLQVFLSGQWFKDWVVGLARLLFVPENVEELVKVEFPKYEKRFPASVSFSSDSASISISLYGSNVNLSGYISEYASGLKNFMNIFVSGLAALFVIRAFRVHFSID